MAQPQILSLSCNPKILVARHELLEQAGFDVTSLADTFAALNLMEVQSFDAVAVGHLFSFTEKQLFAAEVGERWRIPVIVLHDGNADFQLTAGAEVEMMDGAVQLVTTLNALTDREQMQSA